MLRVSFFLQGTVITAVIYANPPIACNTVTFIEIRHLAILFSALWIFEPSRDGFVCIFKVNPVISSLYLASFVSSPIIRVATIRPAALR